MRGSVIGESNDSGSLVQTNTYDEYGNPGSGNAGRFGYSLSCFRPSSPRT
ncbi:MAG: hypothetical protein KIS81_11535 [Maricaulaceae bacterium]|nr:hypothetical protein [Maricaulaceae bacterium]